MKLSIVKRYTIPVGVAVALSSLAFAQDDERLVTEEDATHTAILSGEHEVPPLEVTGTGTAYLIYDAQAGLITWTVTFEGLTGDLTGAHIHGPADETENAGVLIDLRGGEESEGLLEGQAEITEDQASQLLEGLWYVNLHTEENAGGEIRGQVVPIDEAEEVADTAEEAPAGPDEATVAAMMEEGEELFGRNCAVCHGDEGEGGEGPALAGNERVASVSASVGQVLFGGAYMPAFDRFSNDQVAAVATYIRNSWGNDFGPVTADRVEAMR